MASILLMDRVPTAVEQIHSALVIAGHEVFVAEGPHTLHALQKKHRFELALIDIELASVISELGPLVGKVLLLGPTDELAPERVSSAGARGYIPKKQLGRVLQ